MVARGLILAQPMDKLHLETFDSDEEGKRFQWLWYGALDEIHGGCGFSKKLLHTIGRITWITAALVHKSYWVVGGDHCMKVLRNLKQVNSEMENDSSPFEGQPIYAVRGKPEGYVIKEPDEMTSVTAEAWRIAAIAYLQCRLWRYVSLLVWN